MRLADVVHEIGARSGPPAELLAVTDDDVVTIARGIEVEALAYIVPSRLALVEPWAMAGLVVTREERNVRVVGVDRSGVPSAWCGPPGCLEVVTCELGDASALSVMWVLQDALLTEPTMTELYEGLLLLGWLAGPIEGDAAQPVEPGVLALLAGDYCALARAVGVPAPRGDSPPSARLIVAGLHALGVPIRWPLPGESPTRLMSDLRSHVPPKWWFAFELRRLGRPDLAELVMASRTRGWPPEI